MRLFYSLLIFIACSSLSAQGFLRADGQDIVNENGEPYILKGMGVGGWMLQEGYMLETASFANAQHELRALIVELIGEEDTQAFYDAWLANHMQAEDVEMMAEFGFNSVRLPMHYNLYTLPIEEEPVAGEQTWLEKGFVLTDSLISWCKAHDMYVILDLHAAPGGQGMDAGISDYDPSKPSLWESEANRDKTVALWHRLAERYADEPTVAGYDLINEVNWSLPGNTLLRQLYGEITDSIRTVDQNHIIFIEGNWFANDFTGLTPPWDNNMVYSPHKYWSVNDQASIQWALDIREAHNVPLYFGECGENSNVWFKDAIALFDEHNLGWAWWPWKKVESIAGPFSAQKSEGYQDLLDYWNGQGSVPSAAEARTTMMDLADRFKLENLVAQPDVIDAMFRQQESDETLPFTSLNIPGKIHAVDFDMGRIGSAYFDQDNANYQVTTGNFTAWNNGWAYRNDGVDIERTEDAQNDRGYNVGWLNAGEWMQYSTQIAEAGVYNIQVRVASQENGGKFHLAVGEAPITTVRSVQNTGGWQNWQTLLVPGVVLTPEDASFRFYADESPFNLSTIEFVRTGDSESLTSTMISGVTLDENTVSLSMNKRLAVPFAGSADDFDLTVNGTSVNITSIALDPENPRLIILGTDATFRSGDNIRVSYTGNNIEAIDATILATFDQRTVQNTVNVISAVPGRVEAEDFFFQEGIQLENTTDAGGGQNIGFLDAGDYLDYYINVAQPGIYQVDYRTAAESETGAVKLQLIGDDDSVTDLHAASFAATGGWQTWSTTSFQAELPVGLQQIRVLITQPLFNVNWLEFSFLTPTEDLFTPYQLTVSPNPSTDFINLTGEWETPTSLSILLVDATGKTITARSVATTNRLRERFDVSQLSAGIYYMAIRAADGKWFSRSFVVE